MPPEMASIEQLDIDDKSWACFVFCHAHATIFHHPLWSKCLADTYGYEPFVFVIRDYRSKIVGGLPLMEVKSWLTGHRSVSLPFSDQLWPLLSDNENLEVFCKAMVEHHRAKNEGKYLEFRFKIPKALGTTNVSNCYMHFLRLDTKPESLFSKFNRGTVRYSIKKAEKLNLNFSISQEFDALMDFYDLHLMTRKKLGVPTQPKCFFKNVWNNLISRDLGFISIVKYEGKPIAAGVFLHYNKQLVYKYSATDPDHMKLCGNHLLNWRVIQWAYENGMAILDWGRTDKHNQGLRRFKLGWGTEEQELTYSFIGQEPKGYSSGWKNQIVEKTIQKSPVWLGKLVGSMLYKHVG